MQQVPLALPKERNVPTQTKPENIVIAVNKDGDVFWGMEYMKDSAALFDKLKKVAVMQPQPEVHIRADEDTRYESVGRVVATCQRAAILKIGFITEPPARTWAAARGTRHGNERRRRPEDDPVCWWTQNQALIA